MSQTNAGDFLIPHLISEVSFLPTYSQSFLACYSLSSPPFCLFLPFSLFSHSFSRLSSFCHVAFINFLLPILFSFMASLPPKWIQYVQYFICMYVHLSVAVSCLRVHSPVQLATWATLHLFTSGAKKTTASLNSQWIFPLIVCLQCAAQWICVFLYGRVLFH